MNFLTPEFFAFKTSFRIIVIYLNLKPLRPSIIAKFTIVYIFLLLIIYLHTLYNLHYSIPKEQKSLM